jgi:hypothetical protein
VPTYRYRRANDTESVEIVAASCELMPSGVAVFHDVIEEDGEVLLRNVEVRRVRMARGAAPERLDAREVELRLEELIRAREVERQRLEGILQARQGATPGAVPKRLQALSRARDIELRQERSAYSHAGER